MCQDVPGDPAFQAWQVGERASVTLTPHLRPARRVDEIHLYIERVVAHGHAPGHHGLHAERSRCGFGVIRASLESKGARAGCDAQRRGVG